MGKKILLCLLFAIIGAVVVLSIVYWPQISAWFTRVFTAPAEEETLSIFLR